MTMEWVLFLIPVKMITAPVDYQLPTVKSYLITQVGIYITSHFPMCEVKLV